MRQLMVPKTGMMFLGKIKIIFWALIWFPSFARSKKFFIGKAKFWTLWAERYEIDGQLKEADEILEVGEQCLITNPEGLKRLRLWRGNFDLRVATGRSKVIFTNEKTLYPRKRILISLTSILENFWVHKQGVSIRPETCVSITPELCVAITPINRKKFGGDDC